METTNMQVTNEEVYNKLTPHQRVIYDAVVLGHSNKSVANLTCTGEKTVKFHLTNIYKALNMRNRADMIAKHYAKARTPDTALVLRAFDDAYMVTKDLREFRENFLRSLGSVL